MIRISLFCIAFLSTTMYSIETVPSEVIGSEIVGQLIDQTRSVYEMNEVVNRFRSTSKNNAQAVDTSMELLIARVAKHFDIDPLLAALFFNTPKSGEWFKGKITALSPQAKSQKLKLVLDQLVIFTQDSPLFKKILKTVCSLGARLVPTTAVTIDNARYSYTFEDEALEIVKEQQESRSIVDAVYSVTPRSMGYIGNNMLALATNKVSPKTFELSVFILDIMIQAIDDSKTFQYKSSIEKPLDPVFVSRSFLQDRYVLVTAPLKKTNDGQWEIFHDNVSSYSFFIINSGNGSLIKRFDVSL